MPARSSLSSKPRSQVFRPELVRLPGLDWRRVAARFLLKGLARLLTTLWTRCAVTGLENLPRDRPALIVANHLGDADLVIGIACSPIFLEILGKIELLDIPILGALLEAYGVIWVHRGQPDRRALRAALLALQEGRSLCIAPEGRESLSGSLEEGTGGAAYLALKAGVPVVPVTFTGTENRRIYGNMKRFRRTDVSVTVGEPFYLQDSAERREAIRRGTEAIMRALARQLPTEYRGVYSKELGDESQRA